MSNSTAEPLAFLNGEFVPARQAVVPVTDAGFMLGVTIAEQIRTFEGRLFRLDDHIARLTRSMSIVGIPPVFAPDELKATAQQLVAHNRGLLAKGDDLGLSVFVTPGPYATFANAAGSGPLVCMHTYPLPFHFWADKYAKGEALVVASTRQVPTACWPAELKCRSRMHYHLADREARQVDSSARALLLDMDGFVAEASTASVLIYRREEGLVAPPEEKVLPGISLAVLSELAQRAKIPFVHRDLTVEEVASAGEVLLCSTSPCVLPVTRLNGRPIAAGKPGEVFQTLLSMWSELAGLDIARQAQQFARRESLPNR